MNKRNLSRQKMPDIDKVLHLGIVRICKEYERIALQDADLSVNELFRLADLSKLLLKFQREPGFRDIQELHNLDIAKHARPEDMMDVLFGRDEDAENDDGRQT